MEENRRRFFGGFGIAQRFAITGSMDQWGNVQAVGGTNDKLEGFFAVCRSRGLDEEAASLDELEHVFARLSLDQRTILVLHHLERQPVARIAAVLGIPEGTAKWRLHAARAALERSLEEERR